MKRTIMSLFFAAMLLTNSACSNERTATTENPTDSEEAGGNAGDNYMNAATGGDSVTATMPADATAAGSAGAAGTDPGMNANGMDAAGANPNGPTAPHKDDPEFMKSAAHSDQNEIQLSRLVLEKGVTGMAKEHANMMITDHTKSTADLKAIAQKKNVTLPTDMDAEHKAIADQMRQLSGQQLEQRFLQQMVTDHQKTLNTMAAHKAMTQDTELQGFITKTTPVIQKHLTMSKQHADMKM